MYSSKTRYETTGVDTGGKTLFSTWPGRDATSQDYRGHRSFRGAAAIAAKNRFIGLDCRLRNIGGLCGAVESWEILIPARRSSRPRTSHCRRRFAYTQSTTKKSLEIAILYSVTFHGDSLALCVRFGVNGQSSLRTDGQRHRLKHRAKQQRAGPRSKLSPRGTRLNEKLGCKGSACQCPGASKINFAFANCTRSRNDDYTECMLVTYGNMLTGCQGWSDGGYCEVPSNCPPCSGCIVQSQNYRPCT